MSRGNTSSLASFHSVAVARIFSLSIRAWFFSSKISSFFRFFSRISSTVSTGTSPLTAFLAFFTRVSLAFLTRASLRALVVDALAMALRQDFRIRQDLVGLVYGKDRLLGSLSHYLL